MTEKIPEKSTAINDHLILNGSLFLCGTLAAAACGYATAQGHGWMSALPAGILGMLAAGFFKLQFTRKLLSIAEGLQDFLVPAVFAICVRTGVDIWQPASGTELVHADAEAHSAHAVRVPKQDHSE